MSVLEVDAGGHPLTLAPGAVLAVELRRDGDCGTGHRIPTSRVCLATGKVILVTVAQARAISDWMCGRPPVPRR